MAIKNFRIRPEGGNDFADTLHPETNTGMVLDKDGNPMLHDYVRFPGYSIATGTNNYVASLNPAPLAYKEGMRIAIKIGSANTEKATLNVNNLGAKPIRDPEGEELEAGDLLSNQVYNLIYTGTVFQLLGKGGDKVDLTGNALASQVLKDRTFYNVDPHNKLTGTMENLGNLDSTITITGAGKPTKVIDSGYTSGGTITAQLNSSLASSIKKDTTIGGVRGTYSPSVKVAYASNIYFNKREFTSPTSGSARVEVVNPNTSNINASSIIGILLTSIELHAERGGTYGTYGDSLTNVFWSKHLPSDYYGTSYGYDVRSGAVSVTIVPTSISIRSSYLDLNFNYEVKGSVNMERASISLSYATPKAAIFYI